MSGTAGLGPGRRLGSALGALPDRARSMALGAGSLGREFNRRGMREHRAQIAPVAIEVERQVGVKRGHGAPDDALQLRSQLTW